MNNEEFNKINIAFLVINIIIQLYRNITNIETATLNLDVKRFMIYITNKAETTETHDEIDFSTMSEEEIEKYKEDQDVKREADEAIDADQDEINEDFGDEEVQLLDRTSGDY